MTVHARGDQIQSFIAITSWNDNYHFEYIQIDEYVKGDTKPFLALQGIWSAIFSGTCR